MSAPRYRTRRRALGVCATCDTRIERVQRGKVLWWRHAVSGSRHCYRVSVDADSVAVPVEKAAR